MSQTTAQAQIARLARIRLGYYSKSDVARLLGLTPGIFCYHVDEGHIPQPTRQWGQRPRKYYTLQSVTELQRAWCNGGE